MRVLALYFQNGNTAINKKCAVKTNDAHFMIIYKIPYNILDFYFFYV